MATALAAGIGTITATTPSVKTILDGIVNLHASCVLHDGTLATFLPPLDHATMYRWWEERLKEVQQGGRHIIVYLSEVSSRIASTPDGEVRPPFESEGRGWPVVQAVTGTGTGTGTGIVSTSKTSSPTESKGPSTATIELEVSGVVSLATPFSQTGPFRGRVEKLFVSPLHRRKGIGRSVLAKLEAIAWEHGRWNLMLDTTVGSDAEKIYPRLGYTALGVVNDYGYSPKDGQLRDEIWFWKDLRKTRLS
ncbi:hypothetical protein A1O3_04788 [Capronia epimyces CBS 606.96]|uniref:N-acetyltransferase domain-containing protein n=1 Tax=Capronia epimyces CBS 606.96 TaxID=1182542 RepID=W9Y4G7_9EURO|nr:uncharacterized protein A1O3_04788 [Capronia epimyces CBS 606.96]EXJ84121.1 hypothetical protein A1O3_04788 [Capronia epimyces CBS 606.96]